MSRASALAALRGEDAGFVVGIAWLSADVLAELPHGVAHGDPAPGGPAASLALLARDAQLDFALVPAEQPWAAEAFNRLHDAGTAALWAVSGVLGRLGDRLGWSETLRLTAAEPGILAAPLAEALHDALVAVRAGIAAGADAIVVADDLAGSTGPLLSPDFALEALVPCYHRIAAEVAAHGVPAAFHSDGDIRVLLPALGRAGFSAVHVGSLGGDGLSATISAANAAGLTVIGGVEAARLLDDPQRAGSRAAGLARDGRFMMCDDGGLTTAEEVAAYAAAVDAARAAYSE